MNETSKVISFAVPPVVKTVTVRCPPATAFKRFTEDLTAWWPLATHHIGDDPQTCVIEGRVGGRLYERSGAGAECVWGRIEQWDPPRRLVFTWEVKRAPGETLQRVAVTFTPAAGGTHVELVHSGWEALGEAALTKRDSYDKGWGRVFGQCYANYANAAA